MKEELILRKPNQKEFDDWFEMSRRSFAEDLAFVNKSKVEEEYKIILDKEKEILPQGKDTEDAKITVYDTEKNKNIGFTWLGKLQGLQEDQIFLFQITVSKKYRGQGLGRKILNKMHQTLKAEGYKHVLLNVMKRNYAKELYSSLGYKNFQDHEHSMIMIKDL